MLLGTSSVVAGTGFLFSRAVLERCGGWKFFLLSEDTEFTVRNVLDGEMIAYCDRAVCTVLPPADALGARLFTGFRQIRAADAARDVPRELCLL